MGQLKGKTILLVDDEEDLREVLRDEFTLAGAKVLEAGNGRAAFDIVRSQKINLVLSDVRMPGGDGIELLGKIRSLGHAAPAVVLMSGYSDATHEDGLQAGADAVFSKPFDLELLVKAVERIVAESTGREGRRYERILASFSLRVKYEGSLNFIQAKTANLGRGGMFVKLDSLPPQQGEAFEFELPIPQLPGQVLKGTGRCRWRSDNVIDGRSYGMGVEFIGFSPAATELLVNVLKLIKIRSFT